MRYKHCFVNAGRVFKKELNVSDVVTRVDEINNLTKISSIVISDGEPLLQRDIFYLLKELKNYKISLFTNGILINEKNILDIARYVNNIQISMEGVTKEFYEHNRAKAIMINF